MVKIVSKNKKAYHDYFIEEKIEAGISLLGTEVKSCREGKVNFKDAHCDFRRGELFLIGAHISPYTHAWKFNHEPERERKLLLTKRELRRLIGKIKEKGYTLIPLAMYIKGKWMKVEIGLAKGKKLHDKRETARKKEVERQIHANIKKGMFGE
jgi:SsrA-binding protein